MHLLMFLPKRKKKKDKQAYLLVNIFSLKALFESQFNTFILCNVLI